MRRQTSPAAPAPAGRERPVQLIPALWDQLTHGQRDHLARLVGRPDRIVRQGGSLIPEEWKSAKRINHGHRLQLGAYFLLSAQRKHAC